MLILFPLSDTRVERKWVNICQVKNVPQERQLHPSLQKETNLQVLFSHLLHKIRENMVEDGTLRVVATMATAVKERKLVQDLIKSVVEGGGNEIGDNQQICGGGGGELALRGNIGTGNTSCPPRSSASHSSSKKISSMDGGKNNNVDGDNVLDEQDEEMEDVNIDVEGSGVDGAENDEDQQSFMIDRLPPLPPVNFNLDCADHDKSISTVGNIDLDNLNSSFATSDAGKKKMFVLKPYCVTKDKKVLYELVQQEVEVEKEVEVQQEVEVEKEVEVEEELEEELEEEQEVEQEVGVANSRATTPTNLSSKLCSGIGVHLTPTKEKRRNSRGEETNSSKQNKCAVCKINKTSHMCSGCKRDNGGRVWLCHSKTGRDCFNIHCSECH